MSNTRFPYGIAVAKPGEFYAKSNGLIAVADSSPNVTMNALLYTNNTSNTAIENLDFGSQQNAASENQGAIRYLLILDSNSTSLLNNANIKTISSAGTSSSYLPAGTISQMLYANSSWYEVSRSYAGVAPVVSVESKNIVGSAGDRHVIVHGGVNIISALAAASSSLRIQYLKGGEQGQIVTIYAPGSNVLIGEGSGGAGNAIIDMRTSTVTSINLVDSATVVLQKMADGIWHAIGGAGQTYL